MTEDLQIRQLSTGYWHIRGIGPCNWAQPPTWPCKSDVLDAHIFHEAGDSFRRQIHAANDTAWDEIAFADEDLA